MTPSQRKSVSAHPILAGGASAMITTVLYQPLDFLKTQIQEPTSVHGKRSVRLITKTTVNQYSILRLWRGLIPSIIRAVPGGALYFYLLESFKQNISRRQQTMFTNGLFAAFARAVADLTFFPSTFVKTRLESSHYRNMSMMTIVRDVFRSEGVKGFYTGLLPTLARDVPFSAIYYASYRNLKDIFSDDTQMVSKHAWLASQVTIGFTAGLIASFITQPADVIKTYRQVAPTDYRTIRITIEAIQKADGVSGFAKGFFLRAFRRTLVAATTWTLYEIFLNEKNTRE